MTDEQPSSSAAALRAGTQDGAPRARVEFVAVANCDSVIEAEVIKSKLEAEGMTVRLSDANVASVAPHLASSIGGVGVQVAREDENTARDIIERINNMRHPGTQVFRVLAHQGAPFAIVGAGAGIAATALGVPLGIVPPALGMLVPVGLAITGYVIGRKKRRDFCSQLGCAHLIPVGAPACPGCGGKIVGELTDASDRLSAAEALREKGSSSTDPE